MLTSDKNAIWYIWCYTRQIEKDEINRTARRSTRNIIILKQTLVELVNVWNNPKQMPWKGRGNTFVMVCEEMMEVAFNWQFYGFTDNVMKTNNHTIVVLQYITRKCVAYSPYTMLRNVSIDIWYFEDCTHIWLKIKLTM